MGFTKYLKILVEHEIVRRYIIINSFDGALTILGIIFAEFFSHIEDPKIVILPSIGAAIAMCVSGIWGAYSAERAEIKRKIRNLEAHMMKDLSGTDFSKKRERMAWIVGIVDGLSPLFVSFIVIIPFFFVPFITMKTAYFGSMSLIGLVLFALGAAAGKVARESMIKHGIIMLLAGVIIGAIFLLLVFLGVLS